MVYENLKFYTVEEVAKKLRVTEEVIMTIIRGKFLEAVNLGDTGIWIIEEKAILDMIHRGNNMNNESDDNEVVSDDYVDIESSGYSIEEASDEQVIELNKQESEEVNDYYIKQVEHINSSKQGNEVVLESTSKKYIVESAVDNNVVEGKVVDNFNLNNGEKESLVMGDLNVHSFKEDGYMVVNNIKEENVIMEFIFDEEQAKKPVEDEIVSNGDFYDENVHVCDDQEANEQLLKKHGMAGIV